jgi:hypothetical protein
LAYPSIILPRYQSNWNSDKREAFDGHNSESREQRPRRQNDDAKVTLDVDTLGKPGQIVVVSARRRRMLNRSRTRKEKEPRDTISSMLDDLDDEKSTPSDKSIQERIDASRGTYQIKETLPASDFEALCSQLASSFTYKQLSDYILERNRHLDDLKDKQWTWGPRSKSKGSSKEKIIVPKGKARLAEAIVRDCWQLVVDGELGQLDFFLSARSISLLVHAEHFSFHELASLHGCSIDVTQSAGLVSLSGKRNDCEAVHEIILDATARTREMNVEISTYTHGDGAQIFTSDFLEWVNTTYGVFVEQKAYRPPEKILYLAENKSGAEDARRTLNLALTNTTSPSTPFSTYLPASELASAYSYRPEAHASWFERQKSWFRWAMSSSQNAEAPFFDKHQTRLSDELLKVLRNTTPGSAGLRESVTATVGKCLFLQKPSFTDTSISPTQLGRMSLPRIFANDGPLVTELVNSLGPDLIKKDTELYRLRLTPASNARASPDLEIEVAMDPKIIGEISIQRVKAIWSANSVDYLLPENGLDLRFTRTVSQELHHHPSLDSLPTEESSSESAPLSDNQELLESIKQSLQGPFAATGAFSGPVPPPAFCNISLPQYIIQQSASKAELDVSSDGSVTVEYMFPPLSDIRGAVVQKYDFGGRALDYRYYESGPFLAARTNEVSLGMEIPPIDPAKNDESRELLDHEFHSFYNAACDMAFKIHGNTYME